MEMHARLRADFLRLEVETGNTFADVALSAYDPVKRVRIAKKAKAAYAAVYQFMNRVASSDVQSIAPSLESLNHKLVALGEMGEEILGRRLDDRIRKLAAIAEDFPQNSPVRQKITDQVKAEISEYFKREKNPPYETDRRAKRAW